MTLLPLIVGIAFGPAVLLAAIRLRFGAKAARAGWRGVRWVYLIIVLTISVRLAQAVLFEGALLHAEGWRVAATLGLPVLVAFSGALTGLVARTRWVRVAPDGSLLP